MKHEPRRPAAPHRDDARRLGKGLFWAGLVSLFVWTLIGLVTAYY
ncbi:hypothetical protein SH591_13995 [Sphingomonas sp. LY54]|nr:hypothetical protein [Sphingomonas sp. LY54]WRP28199.1 hypothetical protein SH591_13995 [Sphingomonas sp. LY54]